MKFKKYLFYYGIITVTILSFLLFIYKMLNPSIDWEKQLKSFASSNISDKTSLHDFIPVQNVKTNSPSNAKEYTCLNENLIVSPSIKMPSNIKGKLDEITDKMETIEQVINQNSKELDSVRLALKNINLKLDSLKIIKSYPSLTRLERISNTILSSSYGNSYRYNSFINLIDNEQEVRKSYEIIDFEITIAGKLDLIDDDVVSPKKESKKEQSSNDLEEVSGVVCPIEMQYAVIDFKNNFGKIIKNKEVIQSDIIPLSGLSTKNMVSKMTELYSIAFDEIEVLKKRDIVVKARIFYCNDKLEMFPTFQDVDLKFRVYAKNNLDYAFSRFGEVIKFGIDKIYFLLTSIIGLITTAIMTYFKRKLKIHDAEEIMT